MQRILIIGSNGAGKSTFSYKLAEKTQLPLIHLDQIYWRGSWDVRPREEFEEIILGHARSPHWIIEGNSVRSLHQRLPYADTLFWFEFSPLICFFNILRREYKYRGKVRPDMPDQCVSKLDFKFLKYAWNFNRNNRKKISALLQAYPRLTVFHFRNRRSANRFLSSL